MAIRFSCPRCYKVNRVPDTFAGRMGRCGRCGHRFAVPGIAPTTPIFVPMPAGRSSLARRISIGAMSFIGVMAALGFYSVRREALERIDAITSDVTNLFSAVASWIAGATLLTTPVWVPILLSRRGMLSMGRWLILATLFAFLDGIVIWMAEGVSASIWTPDKVNKMNVCICLFFASSACVVGCLLAAAFYPKDQA